MPERKLTIEDVKYALSLHYQGTPFDPYGKLGTEATRGLYRPIGINRNGQLSVVQLRPDVPEAVRAVQWIAYGSNPFNALVPLYANVDEAPEYFANTEARVSTESFYWANRSIAGLADAHFGACLPDIERCLAQGRRRRPPRDRADRPQGARGGARLRRRRPAARRGQRRGGGLHASRPTTC